LGLCNGIAKEGCIPEDWKSSVVLPIYKGKGDPMECGSYRGIKLLEHAMKVVERIFKHRIRLHIDIDDMQYGFTKSKGTTDAIFIVRQMQENTQHNTQPFYGSVEFVRENPGEPVPEETFTHYSHRSHQSSLSAFSI